MATTALKIENQWDFSGLAFLMQDLVVSGTIFIGGNGMSATELGFLDGVTAGTAAASKAVVLDSNKDIATLRNATLSGTLTFSGATSGLGAAGGFSVSPRLCHTGNNPAMATADGTNAAAVTTETYRCEVFVPANVSCTGVAPFNGTAIAGNLQCYLTDSTGTQITGAVTASTAAAGTTVYQRIPWSGGAITLRGPATYWIAIQANNAGYNFRFHTVGQFGADKQTSTSFGTLTVAAAPTTFTTAVGPIAQLY